MFEHCAVAPNFSAANDGRSSISLSEYLLRCTLLTDYLLFVGQILFLEWF
jgi:hypothetical protein